MDTARENITREVGSRIRYARKSRGMSMDELAQAIYKTRSAISKYENGQISVDIATLYDIANALKVSIYDLLYRNTPDIDQEYNAEVPAFFREVSQLYMYFFDAHLNRTVEKGGDLTEEEINSREDIYPEEMYTIAAEPNTKVEYDLHGFIQNIYYRGGDGKYYLDPATAAAMQP